MICNKSSPAESQTMDVAVMWYASKLLGYLKMYLASLKMHNYVLIFIFKTHLSYNLKAWLE